MSLSTVLGAGRGRVEEDGWLPIADLMAGLMMVFVLVTVLVLRNQGAGDEPSEAGRAASAYFTERDAVADSLQQALGEQLASWGAQLDGATLSIDFGAPELNFSAGGTQLSDHYRAVLKDFFPRYLAALAPHEGLIDEVRIEGHASSRWAEGSGAADAWFENMALSQGRTRAVLRYLFALPGVAPYQDWVRQRVVAVGMSSARVVRNPDGSENQARSRRVTFRLITNADEHLARIKARES